MQLKTFAHPRRPRPLVHSNDRPQRVAATSQNASQQDIAQPGHGAQDTLGWRETCDDVLILVGGLS